jgi:hypothetical protein
MASYSRKSGSVIAAALNSVISANLQGIVSEVSLRQLTTGYFCSACGMLLGLAARPVRCLLQNTGAMNMSLCFMKLPGMKITFSKKRCTIPILM